MYDLEKAYKPRFFSQRIKLAWRITEVCNAIYEVLKPKSLIDFGCGNGDLVKGFLNLGIDAYGVEGSKNCICYMQFSMERLKIWDLRRSWNTPPRVDLAMSFEVAEHIEEEFANTYIQNMVRASDQILITAAGPGQGGLNHVNCQPKQYWINLFSAFEYTRDPIIEDLIKGRFIHKSTKGVIAYYKNLLFFERR